MYALGPGYRRHDPDDDSLHAELRRLAAPRTGSGWADLTWSQLIEELLALGRTDIPLARLVEGHVDAVRIAAQAGVRLPDASYGVWASRSGASGVRAEPTGDQLRLTGTLKFASGAGVLDRALVPVWLDEAHHLLVDLAVRHLPVDSSGWQTGAMRVSRTHTVTLDGLAVPAARVVGPQDFYLGRLGFFPGGVGVAAVWAGGLARLLDTLLGWLDQRRSPPVVLRLGRLRLLLVTAVATVRHAGVRLDALLTPDGRARGDVTSAALHQLSAEVRAVVAGAVQAALAESRVLAGPAGLAFDAALTHAIDDLGLYVGQQNPDADATLLGSTVGPAR